MKRLRLTAALLALCMILAWVPVTANAMTIAGGSCGENVTWEMDDEGTMIISGTGPMYDYYPYEGPWERYGFTIFTVIIEDGVTTIGDRLFSHCTELASVTIPGSVTSIGEAAFEYCTGLTEVTIPEGVAAIETGAFMNCTGLTGIAIPASVTSIGELAFDWCDSLTAIWVDENNPVYSSDAGGALLDKAQTTLIRVPGAAVSYPVPEGVTTIGRNAFAQCARLTDVTLPDSLTTIGYGAFSDCSQLARITIPDSVTTIEEAAFWYCTSLSEITIPAGVTAIGRRVFYYCSSLTGICVDEENTAYSSDDSGVLFDKNKSTLLCAPASLDSYTIADSVAVIGEGAFEYCSSLSGISIPDSVTVLADRAFANCTQLTQITIPGSVTTIGELVFYNDSNLKSILFLGDAPDFDPYALSSLKATIYYPANNATWTEEVRQISGRNILWLPYQIGNDGHFHSFVVTEPTCTAEGYTTYTCTECGDSYVDDHVPALGHDYEAVVTPPTYESQGFTTHTCTRCGDSYVDSYVEPLIRYDVLDGDNAQWSGESEAPVAVRVDADITIFVEVRINGAVVDPSNYTVTQGSTIVTLKPEYLASLPAGDYAMEVVFTDGIAEAAFQITSAVFLGDVNGDDTIDTTDAYLIVLYYNERMELDDAQLSAADVNNDGSVDTTDAYYIVLFYNERIDSFPN